MYPLYLQHPGINLLQIIPDFIRIRMFLNLTCHDMGKQLKGVYVVPHHVLHPIHGGFCMPRHGGIHKSGLPFAQYQNSQYIYQQKKIV